MEVDPLSAIDRQIVCHYLPFRKKPCQAVLASAGFDAVSDAEFAPAALAICIGWSILADDANPVSASSKTNEKSDEIGSVESLKRKSGGSGRKWKHKVECRLRYASSFVYRYHAGVYQPAWTS